MKKLRLIGTSKASASNTLLTIPRYSGLHPQLLLEHCADMVHFGKGSSLDKKASGCVNTRS